MWVLSMVAKVSASIQLTPDGQGVQMQAGMQLSGQNIT